MSSVAILTGLVVLTAITWGFYMSQVGYVVGAMLRERKRSRMPDVRPVSRISVLKPLSGLDDELEQNLETFAGQVGVDYEVLFGVASMDDPALAVARRFVERHPEVDARVVLTDRDAALNPKVAQLIGLEACATGDVIVISDSNVRVHPDYLRRLVGVLERPGVSLVSSVLRGTGEQTLGAAIENLLVNTYQGPGVVAGYEISGGKLPVTVGKSLATYRDLLNSFGGIGRWGNVLAEDQAIGILFVSSGLKTTICFDVIDNRNVTTALSDVMRRHSRWAKTRRSIMPVGVVAELLLVPVIWATLALLFWPMPFTAGLFAFAAVTQMLGAQANVASLRGKPMPLWQWPLEVVRVYLWWGCWWAGWFSRRMVWRGNDLTLGAGAELMAASEASRAAVREVGLHASRHQDITALMAPGPLRNQLPS